MRVHLYGSRLRIPRTLVTGLRPVAMLPKVALSFRVSFPDSASPFLQLLGIRLNLFAGGRP